jgi:hypothetical protein
MRRFTLANSSSKENGFGLGVDSHDLHAGGSRAHLMERNK